MIGCDDQVGPRRELEAQSKQQSAKWDFWEFLAQRPKLAVKLSDEEVSHLVKLHA